MDKILDGVLCLICSLDMLDDCFLRVNIARCLAGDYELVVCSYMHKLMTYFFV